MMSGGVKKCQIVKDRLAFDIVLNHLNATLQKERFHNELETRKAMLSTAN